MILLILGLVLWCMVHLIPGLTPAFRSGLQLRLGENAYKGIFSLLIVCAIVLIVFGWKATQPEQLYFPVESIKVLALLLLPVSIYLFVIARSNSWLKRVIRHPQLTGVIIWAAAHLLLNGDTRSLVLFSTLAVWAFFEILLISRREGIWIKSEAPGVAVEIINLLIALVVVVVLYFAHPYIAGVPVSF